jgi:dTDP-4-dehydrorhamnose reductase
MTTPASWQGPVILLGSDGMLGRAFREYFALRQIEFVAPDLQQCDLRDEASIRRLQIPPQGLLLNCAAWTDVDGAEANEAEATAINGEAVGTLASLCVEADAMFITYSTDYVFDGKASAPYRPNALRAPLGAYGRSKAVGEALLEKNKGGKWMNIRTSWLYAPWGKNFVRTMAALLREKREVKVVNDQRGRPTSAEHLARTTLALLGRDIKGHWHITDSGACTWYEFTLEIKRLLDAKAKVLPCTTADFPRPAPRPAYSILDIAATEKLLGPLTGWRDNLADVMGRLE